MNPGARRWVKRGLLVSAGAYAFYLITLNGLLLSKLLIGWINHAQHNVTLDYDWALTAFPGHVSVRGLSVRVQDSAVEFHLTVASARTWIATGALLERTFSARGGDAQGAVLRMRTVRPLSALCRRSVAELPPIPGLTRPLSELEDSKTCLDQTETAFSPGPDTPKDQLWRLRLTDVPAKIDEVWLETFRLRGEMSASVNVWFWPTTELQIDPSVIIVRTATLSSDRTLASELKADVQLSTGTVAIDRDELARIVGALESRLELEAEIQSLGLLDSFLSGSEWISFAQSRGHLVAHIQVDRGDLLEGSSARLDPASLVVAGFGHRAAGKGRASFDVLRVGGERQAQLDVGLSRFELSAQGTAKGAAIGKNLGIKVSAKSPRVHRPLEDLDLAFELESLTVPSLARLNHYIPPGVRLQIRSGSAEVQAELKVRHGHQVERGRIHLLTERVEADYADMALGCVSELTVPISKADMKTGQFEIGGSELSLREGQVLLPTSQKAKDQAWWAKLSLQRGTFSIQHSSSTLDGPLLLASVSAQLANLRPLLVVYGAEGRLPAPIRSYNSGQAKGTFDLALSPLRLTLDHLEVHAGELDARANLHQQAGISSGGLLVGLHGLRVGLEIEGKDSRLVLLDPTETYYRRANDRRRLALAEAH